VILSAVTPSLNIQTKTPWEGQTEKARRMITIQG